LPAVTRANIGQLTPLDLVGAISFFNANYSEAE